MTQKLSDMLRALRDARARTGDRSIATRVKRGAFQVVRVTHDARGRSTVAPVSEYGDAASTAEALREL